MCRRRAKARAQPPDQEKTDEEEIFVNTESEVYHLSGLGCRYITEKSKSLRLCKVCAQKQLCKGCAPKHKKRK